MDPLTRAFRLSAGRGAHPVLTAVCCLLTLVASGDAADLEQICFRSACDVGQLPTSGQDDEDGGHMIAHAGTASYAMRKSTGRIGPDFDVGRVPPAAERGVALPGARPARA